MSNKTISSLIIAGIIALIGIICFTQTLHVNDVQNLQVIQSITGEVTVRRDAGWYMMICPRVWTYPKAGVYQLNAQDKDLLDIQFKNKSTAKLRANIGYRIDTASNDVIIALHQQVESNDEKIWTMILTALNTAAQSITTKYDPSDVIGGDKFEPMIREIYGAIMHNPELLKHGIDVNYFAVDGRPIPDDATQKQFANQREADLSRRLAEAEKVKLEAEKLKVEAQYAREIAEFKGKADAETAKLKTEAEREKELATIAAQKQVEVAKLEAERAKIEVERQKEVARIEAEKLYAVAEVQRKTEAENLEVIKLQAEQKIATAEAKKKEIELSGAITETERIKLEIEKETKIGVAEQMSKTYAHWNPQVIQVSGGNGNVSAATSSLDNFLNMKAAESALQMTKQKSK
jgi:hypothetical protein